MPEPLDPLHIEYATDKVLADMETFADWLSADCSERFNVSSDYECRQNHRWPSSDIPTLLHAAITASLGGNLMMAGEALKLIAERYLAANSDRIAWLASESAMEAKP